MKTLFNRNREATIRHIRELSHNCEVAKLEAKQLMLKGDLRNYFNKLLEIVNMENEIRHDLAA